MESLLFVRHKKREGLAFYCNTLEATSSGGVFRGRYAIGGARGINGIPFVEFKRSLPDLPTNDINEWVFTKMKPEPWSERSQAEVEMDFLIGPPRAVGIHMEKLIYEL